MSEEKKAQRGLKWALLEQSSVQIISFLVFLLLARLLDPQTFGLLAISQIFINLVAHMLQQGFNQAIVQRPDITKQHYNAAFLANMGVSLLFIIVLIFSSPFIAELFNAPRLTEIIRSISIILLISPLYATQQAILRRSLTFKPLALQSLIATIGANTVAVTMALMDYGIWSLIVREILMSAIGSAVLLKYCSWRPSRDVRLTDLLDLLPFSIQVIKGNVVNFLSREAPPFLIGYFLGTKDLGVYHLAKRLVMILDQLISRSLERVAMPLFSRLQHDKPALDTAYLSLTSFATTLVFPLFIGLSLTAELFVPLIFGEKWLASIPIMGLLLLTGISQSIRFISIALMMGTGEVKSRTTILAIEATSKIALTFLLIDQGLNSVTMGLVFASFLVLPLCTYYIARYQSIPVSDQIKCMLPASVCVTLMTLCFFMINSSTSLSPILTLIVSGTSGAIVYISSLYFCFNTTFNTTLNYLRAK